MYFVAAGVLTALLIGAPAQARPLTAGMSAAAQRAPAAGQFLVARRDLPSVYFHQAVILLVRHDARGTVGVLLNRRTRFRVHDLLPDTGGAGASAHPLFVGGPVAPHALVMLMRNTQRTTGIERVTNEIAFSTERTVLESLLTAGQSTRDLRVYAGHSAWRPGQLESELARDSWHLVAADVDSVFADGEETLWQRLIDKLEPPGIRVQR